jgi:hypothetical protein
MLLGLEELTPVGMPERRLVQNRPSLAIVVDVFFRVLRSDCSYNFRNLVGVWRNLAGFNPRNAARINLQRFRDFRLLRSQGNRPITSRIR